ncbi:uncharacterized protein FOMMEDRAFT_82819, partial [Fomitiporia mediterranea MF3/22]|uniref:uncharacterized protein n=1 Tax=Fomitiporia mediterranea (strain MF3/22) TaxID=694068 RepID=UPI000440735F
PIKFFLQKDIPYDERIALEAAVRTEGGIIAEKVPIRGYVIVLPGTAEAERLQTEWRDEARPHRFFVATSWVQACKETRRLIPQVFTRDGYPIKIHVHKSISNVPTRNALFEKISLHGGDPDVSADEASVIVASEDRDVFKTMRKNFQDSEDKFVENLKWLDICIGQQIYYNTPTSTRNPGGRRTGEERMPFTEEDEANLCNWIATVIPFKESGGRTGNKIYMELVGRAGQPGYEWVARHTWQSWRERYKKNSERLDRHIAAIVNVGQANGTIVQDRAPFGYFKLTEGRRSQSRRRKRQESEGAIGEELSREPSREIHSTQTQDEEWAIREGNNPTPDWAKRSSQTVVDFAESNSNEHKRQKVNDATFRTFVLAPANEAPSGPSSFSTATEFAADFGHHGPVVDPAEHEILAIARDQRFLADEVRAYYQRSGDLMVTRQRFERVRALIDNLP